MEHMHKICGTVMGLLMAIAGGAFLGSGLGYFDGMTAAKVAGGSLLLFGLGKLAHVSMLCPVCNGKKK